MRLEVTEVEGAVTCGETKGVEAIVSGHVVRLEQEQPSDIRFRANDLGFFLVWNFGFGLSVLGLGFGVLNFGHQVWRSRLGYRILRFRSRSRRFRILRIEVWRVGCRVSGLWIGVYGA